MPRQKSFSYIIRLSQAGPELLVFDSLEEPGLEVPKGSAQLWSKSLPENPVSDARCAPCVGDWHRALEGK